MDTNSIIDISSAALTPLVAITVAYVAWQQYRINRTRLQHELYEKRSAIFKAVTVFIIDIMRYTKIDPPGLSKFYADTAEADFLFKKDIREHIDKLYNKGIDLFKICDKLYPEGRPGLPVGQERNAYSQQHAEILRWFSDELTNNRNLFAGYLRLT